MNFIWDKLNNDVINSGLCTHCGTCVGLNKEIIGFKETEYGPLPLKLSDGELDPATFFACPGKGVPYPTLYHELCEDPNQNFVTGKILDSWIGYSNDIDIRLNSASGGIITTTLIYLLDTDRIDGAIVVKAGEPSPESAMPIIATSRDEILASSQSVYRPIPVNIILDKTRGFKGRLSYVGLPDQVASIRMLQMAKHPSVSNIKYILGPYTGTNMYKEAIRSFLRGRGVNDSTKITSLKWRAGEWPGYLEVILEDDRVFRAEKFYFNYLTPFFITKSTLFACDFTNELTDISVGDAWSPKYEKQRKGFSVILARTKEGKRLLEEMRSENKITLEEVEISEAMNMHGHMLDFKKRGSFIRIETIKKKGRKVPLYGYAPGNISKSRRMIEKVVYGIFFIASKSNSRRIAEKIPISILGPIFNYLRIKWKKISKPTKRKGLLETRFIINNDELELLSNYQETCIRNN